MRLNQDASMLLESEVSLRANYNKTTVNFCCYAVQRNIQETFCLVLTKIFQAITHFCRKTAETSFNMAKSMIMYAFVLIMNVATHAKFHICTFQALRESSCLFIFQVSPNVASHRNLKVQQARFCQEYPVRLGAIHLAWPFVLFMFSKSRNPGGLSLIF